MRVIGVIPARGGSKRLPGKNIRDLGGRPLICWTIEAALSSAVLEEVVVSTDDAEIAAVAREAGAAVLALRPAELATDTATSQAVLLHEVEQWEAARGSSLDGALLLQPTSPFRTADTIRAALQSFEGKGEGQCTVVGLGAARTHPFWCLSVDPCGAAHEMHTGGLGLRSQDLPPAFAVNGTIYLVPRAQIRAGASLYTERKIALIVEDDAQSVDIDTLEDWRLAEAIIEDRNQG
jgi:N-acylneuraminate cytidylyltransferase/CMP-N,N'-diacetyllegionaminic acid synthase